MNRAPLDLRYEHEMRAVPRHATMPSEPLFEARGLVARLRGLQALMDAEHDSLATWIAAQPHVVLS